MNDTPRTDRAARESMELMNGAVWKECKALERELNAANERIKQLEEFVRSVADNFDCDQDAHRYRTQCRACDAQQLIEVEEDKL